MDLTLCLPRDYRSFLHFSLSASELFWDSECMMARLISVRVAFEKLQQLSLQQEQRI
jgi:hypothetical protein